MEQVALMWIPTVFRVLSMVTGFIVIIVYALMTQYRPALADRISLRLVFAANISVVFLTVWQIVVVLLPSRYKASCLTAQFFLMLHDTCTCLFLMFVGINLMLVIVVRITPSKMVECGYYFTTVLISIANGIAVVIPTDIHLYDSQSPTCWYQVFYTTSPYLVFSTLYRYMFSIAVLAICVFAFASTLIVLFSKKSWIQRSCDLTRRNSIKNNPRDGYNAHGGGSCNQAAMYKKVAMRCMVYPAILVFTKLWGTMYVVLTLTSNEKSNVLLILDQCVSGTTGILVGLIFISDPAVIMAAKDCKEFLRCRFVDEYSALSGTVGNVHRMRERRKSVRVVTIKTRRSTQISNESIIVDKVIDYHYPKLAQYTHWVLLNVLKWKKRPRKCRNPSSLRFVQDDLPDKSKYDTHHFINSPAQSREQIRPPAEFPPPIPEIEVSTSDDFRIQFEKYTINEDESEIDNDDVTPHFPTYILNEIHPCPVSISAHQTSPTTNSDEEDYHSLNDPGLDLEAVGSEHRPMQLDAERQR